MSPSDPARRRLRLDGATGIGLGFVYLGIPLLAAIVHHAAGGAWLIAGLLGVCLVGVVGTGVGLCARERWAWAVGVCLCVSVAGAAVTLGGTAAAALAAAPRALSWQPIFLGLTRWETQNLLNVAALAGVASLAAAPILWRRQEEYDVPHRRGYTTLSREGALPAAVIVAAALYAAAALWQARG